MRRIVLDEAITLDEVRMRGAELGWEVGAPVTTSISTETPIRSSDSDRYFLFLEDGIIGAQYFRLDALPIAPDAAQIAEHFEVVDRRRLIEILDEVDSVESAVEALAIASAYANEALDPVIFDFLTTSMNTAAPEVRRWACVGATYAGWRELAGPLTQLLEHDGDETVRRSARLALEALNEELWHDPSITARLEREGTNDAQ